MLGELIGINTAIRGDAQNVGFAIPVDALRGLLPGILSPEQVRKIEVGLHVRGERPARVAEVVQGSPAAEAGIQPGDALTAIDGRAVNDALDFCFEMLTRQAGERVGLTLERDGVAVNVSLALREVPRPDGATLARQRLGLVLREVRTGDGQSTVLMVEGVTPDSPAAAIGIQPGDALWQLGRFHVSSLDEVGRLLAAVGPGDRFPIRVIRTQGRVMRTLTGQIEAR